MQLWRGQISKSSVMHTPEWDFCWLCPHLPNLPFPNISFPLVCSVESPERQRSGSNSQETSKQPVGCGLRPTPSSPPTHHFCFRAEEGVAWFRKNRNCLAGQLSVRKTPAGLGALTQKDAWTLLSGQCGCMSGAKTCSRIWGSPPESSQSRSFHKLEKQGSSHSFQSPSLDP